MQGMPEFSYNANKTKQNKNRQKKNETDAENKEPSHGAHANTLKGTEMKRILMFDRLGHTSRVDGGT